MNNIENLCRCPISLAIFLDPVIASDGYTYERQEILKYKKTNSTSPMTRDYLTSV